MLDGRIDTQGIVEELRAGGVLDEITQETAAEVEKEGLTLAKETDHAKFEGKPSRPRSHGSWSRTNIAKSEE
jgi:hypothetical protein